MRDPQTLKSKAYGFVSFTKKVEAENAIAQMNGQKLGSRSIITNWHYPTMKKIANDSELEEKVRQIYKDNIKYLVKKNADLAKDRIDVDKLKDDLKNVKAKLKVITDENEGLNIQVKENEALKKTLKIQQEFLEIAKSHLKGEPVQKPDLEREVRKMLIEQFGQEATEKLGIEIEDGEILDDHNQEESGIEIIIDEPEKDIEVIEPEKKIEVVQLDMD